MRLYFFYASLLCIMKKIILQSVNHNGNICDIVIEDNTFKKITTKVQAEDLEHAEIIDCSHFAIFPAFYNAHTHGAMTLLRGFADDMPLFKWLNEYIWPFEAKITADDVEIGSRLAVLEMIKSGTVFFADMYWKRERTMKVVEEMGIRAAIGVTISDQLTAPNELQKNFDFLKNHTGESERIHILPMPHAIYTNSEECFKKCIQIAKEENYFLHTHLSETQQEVDDCRQKHNCSPVELMDKWGALSDKFSAAHCVYFSDSDMQLFKSAQSTAVLNPTSNLKLSSGIPNIAKMLTVNMNLAIGTDGTSSNNNLDMHEDMKLTTLLAKVTGAAETLPAEQVLEMATYGGAKTYGLSNAGKIEEGFLADAILVDLNNERMNPQHNLVSNWVYSADSSVIDSVICNGKFVMKHRHVDGEEDIIREANKCALQLAQKF